jgi:hypothetical protein
MKSSIVGTLLVAILAFPIAGFSQQQIKGTSETFTLKEFQSKYHLNDLEMKKRLGAVGRVICPFAYDSAFLIGKSDVFITSDHVFLSIERKAKVRGRIDRCFLEFFYSKGRFKMKSNSLVHGLRTNKDAYDYEGLDWAVGRLQREVKDVQPFRMREGAIPTNTEIMMVSQGMNDFQPRICIGRVVSSNIVFFATTCGAGPGASGGPIVAGAPVQNTSTPWTELGVTRGYQRIYEVVEGLGPREVMHVAIPMPDTEIMKALVASGATLAITPAEFINCTYLDGSRISTKAEVC